MLTLTFISMLTAAPLSPKSTSAQARAAAASARTAFEAGDFARAATLLQQAHALEPVPELLYNLGRARERTDDLEGAIDAYERYLRDQPAASDRAAIEKTVADLHARVDERRRLSKLQQEAAALKAAPPTLIERPAWRKAAPISVLGLGAAGIAAATVLGLYAQGRYHVALSTADLEPSMMAFQQARALETPINAVWATALTVVLVGSAWLLWELVAHR